MPSAYSAGPNYRAVTVTTVKELLSVHFFLQFSLAASNVMGIYSLKHSWSSGRIRPCYGRDPGSIPGRCSMSTNKPSFLTSAKRLCPSRAEDEQHSKEAMQRVRSGTEGKTSLKQLWQNVVHSAARQRSKLCRSMTYRAHQSL